MSDFLHHILIICCAVLAVAILFCMVRAFQGPRFTDRVVAINLIGTITIVILAILTVALDADYLIDVSISYALLSFIAIVVLMRLVIVRRRGQMEREEAERKKEEASHDQ